MDNYPHMHKIPKNAAEWIDVLINLARYLRSPDGCPWDREQTSLSFAKFHEEESRELVQAFDGSDNDHIAEEMGDCLFTLLAAAVCAEEEGRFTLLTALERTHEKMIRRHGHVFGADKAQSPEAAMEAWQKVKKAEKQKPAKRKRR